MTPLEVVQGVWPGAEYAVTPHLDRLASQGARYDNAFATAPVCSPSRSSVITGCYPTAIGTMHHRTKAVPPPEVRLLPEYFRAAGYYTTNNFLTDVQVTVPTTVFDECRRTAHWRNRPTPDTPFFASFHGFITHESQIYVDDEQFAANTRHVADGHRHDPAQAPLPPCYPDTPVFRRAWARYSDLITEMDHSVGEILQQLEEDGLAESTVVVFWSDHGLGMPRGKRWVTESGLREPLRIRWPGRIAPNTVREELVSLMDLAPTMLSMCGMPVPQHMHGVPLLDAAGTMADAPHEYVFGARDRMDEQEDNSRSVRDSRFRYIRRLHPDRSSMQYCSYPDHLATWR
ncbi:sulfatase family protein [Streptomyces hyaluromycini]|uniref:sulfatase family protein n=1 Tax=Streptomyces hyaluromycini TaxID=1377993 RepID=UPI00142DF504|nr:sulfatase [Streptomyces hyaluromycini]